MSTEAQRLLTYIFDFKIGYDDCEESHPDIGHIPAKYEAWWELTGPAWVTDRDPPMSTRQALCEKCAAETREDARKTDQGEYAMKLHVIRTLR